MTMIDAIIRVWLAEQSCPVHEFAWIDPKEIPFSAAVREACAANFCGRYNKCWTCPPGCGDWEMLRDRFCGYHCAFLFTTCSPLEDSFDLEGMEAGRKIHEMAEQELQTRLNGLPYQMAGAGSCSNCETCTYPDAPCRFPERAKSSMEACGIDVVNLSKKAGVNYINGSDTVTYFSVLFYDP